MKSLTGLLGVVEGLKLGTIQSLDTMNDDHVSDLMRTALRRVAAGTKLAKARQKRLLQLLRDAAHYVHEEL